jgi:hypothetical protein
MTIDEYKKLYPNESVWRIRDGSHVTVMLQFDEETACNLAGPFEGNYAYVSITDYRTLKLGWKIPTEAEYQQRHRFSQYHLPYRNRPSNPATTEAQLQQRLKALTEAEQRQWQRNVDKLTIEFPTQENPVALYVAGNDDSTYTKFFPTIEAAQEELDLLLAVQPVNMQRDLTDNGFVFTN